MRTLRLGHRGDDVAQWQRFLTKQKLKPGPVDGIFGTDTQAATIAFQKANGLAPDGGVGPGTLAAAQGFGFTSVVVDDLAREVALPSASEMNDGLNAASHATMMGIFGAPGKLTKQCSEITNPRLKKETVTADVGPFRVTGWKPAVDSLRVIFAEIKNEMPEVFAQVQTAGMSCVRHVRQNPSRFSNHSWGTAVDVFFGSDVDDTGDGMCQAGLLKMAPIFNKHRWYWGAEFSLEDSMHFEVSEQLIRELSA
jgi:hypothetical protein